MSNLQGEGSALAKNMIAHTVMGETRIAETSTGE